MNSLATDVGVSSHTIKSWISILEASNIIFLLKPFYHNYGKRLVKSPKLYFRDNHGNEIDFIIPEGEKLRSFECKWKFQSGVPPKNLEKFKSIVGAENIIESKVITSSDSYAKISKDCVVTNLVEL
jgi:predicted AAA+ superfamily ATPase